MPNLGTRNGVVAYFKCESPELSRYFTGDYYHLLLNHFRLRSFIIFNISLIFTVSISQVTVVRLLSLVMLMGGYFFSPCHCIPVKIENSNDEPWWCQPCSQEHKTRHSRGINEPLKTQLSAAIGNYENEISKYVNLLDNKVCINISFLLECTLYF